MLRQTEIGETLPVLVGIWEGGTGVSRVPLGRDEVFTVGWRTKVMCCHRRSSERCKDFMCVMCMILLSFTLVT